MSNLSIQENSCSFSEDVVMYIYDEMTSPERIRYESHLAGCSICAQEIEGFSNASQMIQNWRTDAFENLSTPKIYVSSSPVDIDIVSEPMRKGWISTIQAFFHYPKIATVGFAFGALIIAAVIFGAILVVNYRTDELTRNEHAPEVFPKIGNSQVNLNHDQPNSSISSETPTKNSEPKLSETAISTDPVEVPASSPKRLRPRSTSRPRIEQISDKQNVGFRGNITSPRLSQFEEYKDDSLRLSDLMDDFDELGAS